MNRVKTVCHVVGARPNFMKLSPVYRSMLASTQIKQLIVHTGQHYSDNMSNIFFAQLNLPEPSVNLKTGLGDHVHQISDIMNRFDNFLVDSAPDMVLLYGDVNSTLAAALVCAKNNIPVAHVEAGLRSFDRTMPEEINRVLTDQISDLLFTPSVDGNENLIREGKDAKKIFLVGNVMIDCIMQFLKETEENPAALSGHVSPYIEKKQYSVLTLHRPSNVDSSEKLGKILSEIIKISHQVPVIFPIHPRTEHNLKACDLTFPNTFILCEPLGYIEFLFLLRNAKFVITDSGGIQEETTYLNIPCLTLRENTERPITITCGTNTLIGEDFPKFHREVEKILNGSYKQSSMPPYWDGHSSERIAHIINVYLQ
ncbi:MAG: non-hydrolyzing UDP-N-acetylglucosamine 2-epimerase [bacterium]